MLVSYKVFCETEALAKAILCDHELSLENKLVCYFDKKGYMICITTDEERATLVRNIKGVISVEALG